MTPEEILDLVLEDPNRASAYWITRKERMVVAIGTTLDELFETLKQRKKAEAMARTMRVLAEEAILNHVKDAPEQGSVTLKGENMRCSIKFSRTYKADIDALREIDAPAEVIPVSFVPSKYVFDPKRYEDVRVNHPDVFKLLAEHVTVKAAKPGLTLKV